jgi:DNA-binding CsgD family transcriptional regulator
MSGSRKLPDQVRTTCRRLHYSLHTKRAYVRWVVRFVRIHGTVHPRSLDARDVKAFLNDLAVERQVAGSTQNQALNVLVFLYNRVQRIELGDMNAIDRALRRRNPPMVCTRQEVQVVPETVRGTNRLVALLLYAPASDCLRLYGCVLKTETLNTARS